MSHRIIGAAQTHIGLFAVGGLIPRINGLVAIETEPANRETVELLQIKDGGPKRTDFNAAIVFISGEELQFISEKTCLDTYR